MSTNNQIGAEAVNSFVFCVERICPGQGKRASRPNRSRQRSCPCTQRCCLINKMMRCAENLSASQPTSPALQHTFLTHSSCYGVLKQLVLIYFPYPKPLPPEVPTSNITGQQISSTLSSFWMSKLHILGWFLVFRCHYLNLMTIFEG